MRASLPLAGLAVLLLGSSCGVQQKAASQGSTTRTDATVTTAFSSPWGVDIAQPEPEPGAAPLAEQLAVFAGARDASDKLGFSEETPPDMASGKELFSQSRLLLPQGPIYGEQLFGVPTAKGWVCPYLLPPDGGEWDAGGG